VLNDVSVWRIIRAALDIRIGIIATNGDAKPLLIDGYIGELGLIN
jgi:hypothetical protein